MFPVLALPRVEDHQGTREVRKVERRELVIGVREFMANAQRGCFILEFWKARRVGNG